MEQQRRQNNNNKEKEKRKKRKQERECDVPVIHSQREILIQLFLIIFSNLRTPQVVTIPTALRQYVRGFGKPGGYGIRVGSIWATFVFGEREVDR